MQLEIDPTTGDAFIPLKLEGAVSPLVLILLMNEILTCICRLFQINRRPEGLLCFHPNKNMDGHTGRPD
jgi:hypothetical protein